MEKFFDMLAYILVIVGALNWGLVGAFDFNLVTTIFGMGMFTKVTYIVVGLAAVYVGFTCFKGKCPTK